MWNDERWRWSVVKKLVGKWRDGWKDHVASLPEFMRASERRTRTIATKVTTAQFVCAKDSESNQYPGL